jgi:pimeloyl-ACP methyl ester carboxylesterase
MPSCEPSQVPILLIHGKDDRNIPVRHSRRIAALNPAVALWEVPNADHCGAILAAPSELEQRVVGWFERKPGR